MADRIIRPDTAFSTVRQKTPRIRSEAHLAWVRELPCLVSGRYGCEAAHIRYAEAALGKSEGGAAIKPGDVWVVPLSPPAHRDQHANNERAWWADKNIDPLIVAALLYAVSGRDEQGCAIIAAARSGRFPFR